MKRFLLTILSAGGFVGSVVWFIFERGFEPAITSALSLAGLIALFIDETRAAHKTNLQLQREEKASKNMYQRIQKEKRNFEILASEQPISYSGESHRKAVEEYPWELMQEATVELEDVRLFPRLTRKLNKSIEVRNPRAVLQVIAKLEPKLKRHFIE